MLDGHVEFSLLGDGFGEYAVGLVEAGVEFDGEESVELRIGVVFEFERDIGEVHGEARVGGFEFDGGGVVLFGIVEFFEVCFGDGACCVVQIGLVWVDSE